MNSTNYKLTKSQPRMQIHLSQVSPTKVFNVLVDRTDRRPALAQKRDFRFFVVGGFLRRAWKSFWVALLFNEVLDLKKRIKG